MKGLDKGFSGARIFLSGSMQPACEHTRTEIIARRNGIDYVECLDCRQVFEAEDLEPVTIDEDDE